jgi:asparagine synthase (glutamine-hydrolysing)
MCGICGYWTASGDAPPTSMLKAMNTALTRRGPDGEGYFEAAGIGLAMRRLAIIDLEGGWQPIYNEDRSVVVVMNGEIYNYAKLRQDLLQRGHRFATASDTEVLVHLYEEYGDELATHLEGMFAFALWDVARRRLLVVRDRLGIKPLYYAFDNGRLYFGSEIKAILASGQVATEIDYEAFDQFFAYNYIPAPASIYRAIRKLPAATRLVVEADGSHRMERYWQLPEGRGGKIDDRDAAEVIEKSLRAAVESHLVSDVPVGAFLSGGVDSGLIVAMAASMMDKPLSTFTIGFGSSGKAFLDERGYAREIATRYGCDHHEFEVKPDVESIFDDIIQAFDEPFADDSVIPSYYVSQLAVKHLKVALTGLGGDELFGGYRRHAGIRLDERLGFAGDIIRAALSVPVRLLPESLATSDAIDHVKRFVRTAGTRAERYAAFLTTQPTTQRHALYSDQVRARLAELPGADSVISTAFSAPAHGSGLKRALYSDLSVYLPDDVLTLSDRLSMWHSLELRVPFLDRQLVEAASRLSDRMLIDGSQQKRVLREIATRLLPKSITSHRKQGFEAPMGAWLRGPLLDFFDSIVTEKAIMDLGLLNWIDIKRLRDEHVSGKQKNSKALFAILILQTWSNDHIVAK